MQYTETNTPLQELRRKLHTKKDLKKIKKFMEEQVYLQLQPHSETIAAIMRIHTHIFYPRSDQCNIF